MQACRLCQNRDFLLQSTLSQNLLLYLLRSEAVLYPTSGTTSDSATILQSAAGFGHHFLPRFKFLVSESGTLGRVPGAALSIQMGCWSNGW